MHMELIKLKLKTSGEYRIYHPWRCTHQQNADYSRLRTSLRGLLQLYIQL